MFKKRKVFLRVAISLSLGTATLLHATNGDTLIAVGTKARGMGGVGIAMSHGAESALTNPASITEVQETEISFGGTLFMPDVKSTGMDGTFVKSDADMNIIPEVSLANKINENFYVGVGMWGTAGMGTDYEDNAGNANMKTNLQLMQFGVPFAYKADKLSIGIAPILQYGSLDISHQLMTTSTGVSQDFGFGFSAGLTYDITDNLTFGAVYKSPIKMTYKGQLSGATSPFVTMGIFPGEMADDLEQPSEMGVGLAYTIDNHTFAMDYKRIKWSSAKGYKDFGWEDQNVFALGYQYKQDNWALRCGYNQADSAVVEMPMGATVAPYAAINMFNLLGFPATSEKHYTVGGTYEFSNSFSLDLAYVYSPKSTKTYDIAGLPMPVYPTVTTTHSENSISFQLTYKF